MGIYYFTLSFLVSIEHKFLNFYAQVCFFIKKKPCFKCDAVIG